MKVLIIGSGGREHALVWKIAQSPKVTKIYCAPGNAGINNLAECVPIEADDLVGLLEFALAKKIDLTIVGPEVPLVLGIVDLFQRHSLAIFGPRAKAAAIEGSKSFAKELMDKYQIPTAKYGCFEEPQLAKSYIQVNGTPCVIKADGLAAGKGVVVATNLEEAFEAVDRLMNGGVPGTAGNKIVVEEFLQGQEVSVMALSDGKTVKPLAWAKDHKRAYEGEQGPNTGGMGTISPPPSYSEELAQLVTEKILQPTIDALATEGTLFQGVLFAGLMLTKDGPKVLEFNARFGDPETQVVLMRLENDLVEIIESVLQGNLSAIDLTWKEEAAVCVVLVSDGYPGKYEKGLEIKGLDTVREDGLEVFHAGTVLQEGKIVTAGGRVLGVTALAGDISKAAQRAYAAAEKIDYPNKRCRGDIGKL
ncbi:MAG: phosphoribosylamine--glycine ligase [Zhaonellaceae bacterium]|nr:phosphoribosylamine--glycine ligase [Clostridia bacterium]